MIDYYETSDRRTLSLLELSRLCEKHMISEEDAAQSAPQREPSGGGVASSLGQAVLDQLRSLSGDDEPAALTLTANDRSADSQRLRKFDDRIVSPKCDRRPSCFARYVQRATDSGGAPMGAEDDGGADASEEPPSASSMSNTFERSLSRSLSGTMTMFRGGAFADETERTDDAATSVELGDYKDEHPDDGADAPEEMRTMLSGMFGLCSPHDMYTDEKIAERRDVASCEQVDTDSGQEATTASSSADITMDKVIHSGDGVANVGAAARSEEGGVVRFGCPREPGRRSVAMLAHAHRTMSRSSSKRGGNTEEDAVVDRANVSSCGLFRDNFRLVAGQRLVHVGDNRSDLWPRECKDVQRWLPSDIEDNLELAKQIPVQCTFSALAWQDHMWIWAMWFRDHVWHTQGELKQSILEERTPLRLVLRTLRCLAVLAVVLVLIGLMALAAAFTLLGFACAQFLRMIFNRFVAGCVASPPVPYCPRIDPFRAPCQRVYPPLIRECWPRFDHSWLPEDPEALRENRHRVQGFHGYMGAGERVLSGCVARGGSHATLT